MHSMRSMRSMRGGFISRSRGPLQKVCQGEAHSLQYILTVAFRVHSMRAMREE
jgi:hypothetical protein